MLGFSAGLTLKYSRRRQRSELVLSPSRRNTSKLSRVQTTMIDRPRIWVVKEQKINTRPTFSAKHYRFQAAARLVSFSTGAPLIGP